MRLVTVRTSMGDEAGILRPDGAISGLERFGHQSVLDLIEAGPAAWQEVEEASAAGSNTNANTETGDIPAADAHGTGLIPAADAVYLPPILRTPRNMVCVGLNYREHFDEGDRPEGSAVPEAPVLFTKPWTSLSGHDSTVEIDRAATNKADWEAEIAVVIGVGGRNISEEDALGHVFGYTLANDLSARDLQLEHGMFGQWFKGKSLDGFCPMGPAVVTAPEVGDYRSIEVELRVNGVVKQSFRASSMVNSVPRIIARLSLGCSLVPGDVILTGTAAGVGHWRKPPEFLGDGDTVEIESPQLGLLRTHFTEAPTRP